MKLYRSVPITGSINKLFTEKDMIYDKDETGKIGIYFSSYPAQSMDMVCEYYHKNENEYMFLTEYELTDDIHAIVGKYTHQSLYYDVNMPSIVHEILCILELIKLYDDPTVMQFIIHEAENKQHPVIIDFQKSLNRMSGYKKYKLPEELNDLAKDVFNLLKTHDEDSRINTPEHNPISNILENHISSSAPINFGRLQKIIPETLKFDGYTKFHEKLLTTDNGYCETHVMEYNKTIYHATINTQTNKIIASSIKKQDYGKISQREKDIIDDECNNIFNPLITFAGEVFIANTEDLKNIKYIKTSVIRAHEIEPLFKKNKYDHINKLYDEYLNNNCISDGKFKPKPGEELLPLQFSIAIKKGIISNLEYEKDKIANYT